MKATWDSNCFSVSNGIYLRLYVYYMIQDIAVKHCDGVHVTHATVFVAGYKIDSQFDDDIKTRSGSRKLKEMVYRSVCLWAIVYSSIEYWLALGSICNTGKRSLIG
jgi:hypothetical protein